jgi:hypothetical protein
MTLTCPHEGDELFVEHGDMRAQFLWQTLRTFNNVLANKKWDGIIICIVLVREGEAGEFRNVGAEIRNLHYCVCTKRLQY